MSQHISSSKKRFPISVTNEFLERLDSHAGEEKKTKSELLEEYADILIGLPKEEIKVLRGMAKKNFRSISEQAKHIIHEYISSKN